MRKPVLIVYSQAVLEMLLNEKGIGSSTDGSGNDLEVADGKFTVVCGQIEKHQANPFAGRSLLHLLVLIWMELRAGTHEVGVVNHAPMGNCLVDGGQGGAGGCVGARDQDRDQQRSLVVGHATRIEPVVAHCCLEPHGAEAAELSLEAASQFKAASQPPARRSGQQTLPLFDDAVPPG